jgi:phosphotransferase system HPr-like phosphotransfer protein
MRSIIYLEVGFMKSIKISLAMSQKVKEFVNITQNYSYEIVLKSGRYVVDAKSILGIYSLDLANPVTVEVYSDDCDDLMELLKKFEA